MTKKELFEKIKEQVSERICGYGKKVKVVEITSHKIKGTKYVIFAISPNAYRTTLVEMTFEEDGRNGLLRVVNIDNDFREINEITNIILKIIDKK